MAGDTIQATGNTADGAIPTQSSPITGELQAPAPVSPETQTLAAEYQHQQAAQQQPPQPGVRPNFLNLLDSLTGKGIVGKSPSPLSRPVSRMDAFEGFLANFLQSMSAGMQVHPGPGANLRAAGAAMQAPYQQAVNEWELRQQASNLESERQFRQAQGESLRPSIPMTGPNGETVMIPPAHVGQVMLAGYRFAGAKYAADVRGATAKDVAGLKYGPPIEITDDLAKAYGLSSDLVGEKLTPGAIQRMAPNAKVISTSEGMFFADPRTGQKIGPRLGSTPSVTNAQLRSQTQITVEQMRDSTRNAQVFNAAAKPAQIMYQTEMKGIQKWADNEQKIGYLDYGADPQQARTAFEAEQQRRIDASNRKLLDSVQSRVGSSVPGNGTPAATPTPVPTRKTPTVPPQASAMAKIIAGDPALQKAQGVLDKIDPSNRRVYIDDSKSLSNSQKAILKGFYGVNK